VKPILSIYSIYDESKKASLIALELLGIVLMAKTFYFII
jgi:hypothetical protein